MFVCVWCGCIPVDSVLDGLALHQPREEAAAERVTSSVGVHHLDARRHRELLDAVGRGNDRGERPLRHELPVSEEPYAYGTRDLFIWQKRPLPSSLCTYVCMYVCMHVCMYACMHACMHACMYACIYACMYVCMHVCVYVTWVMTTMRGLLPFFFGIFAAACSVILKSQCLICLICLVCLIRRACLVCLISLTYI